MLALLAGPLLAQDKPAPPPKPPALTEVQKLTLQTLLQRIEIAQLRAQAAQRDFEQARDEAQKLLSVLQVPGYTLDLQTGVYTVTPPKAGEKKPEPPKPEPKK